MHIEIDRTVFERKVTGAERFFVHAPFSTVTMVARINGTVTGDILHLAVAKVQQRHALLRARLDSREDALWFTSEGVGDIPITVVPRTAADDWIQHHEDGCKVPFDFEERPAIRFILVQSTEVSELIILCHHIICDGLSLVYLVRDLLVHLGDPTAAAEILPPPPPITLENLPAGVAPSGLMRYFINRIRRNWQAEQVIFDQEDYEALNRAYWENYDHEIVLLELSETETRTLVARCRSENVTVNTALMAAFSAAQHRVVGAQPHHAQAVTAVSLRDRLPQSPGEGMGYYAQGLQLKLKYNPKKTFWDNARAFHRKIMADLATNKVFGDLPAFLQMDANIYEALSFKKLGALVAPDEPRFQKLSGFSRRQDVVVRLLKRAKMESLASKLIGPAITNLGRVDIPSTYGSLTLDRLIVQPGGAFPLVHVDMVIGVVTCAGKMSIVVEYAAQAVDTATMMQIKEEAMALLLDK